MSKELKKYLTEYNSEFDSPIKPLEVLDMTSRAISLEYRFIDDSELHHIIKFCSIYGLHFAINNTHGYTYVTINK